MLNLLLGLSLLTTPVTAPCPLTQPATVHMGSEHVGKILLHTNGCDSQVEIPGEVLSVEVLDPKVVFAKALPSGPISITPQSVGRTTVTVEYKYDTRQGQGAKKITLIIDGLAPMVARSVEQGVFYKIEIIER